MKFCVSLLLLPLLLFDTLQGSTLPHVRKVRALNTTLQTNFNGTYERRNPCTNAEIESSSYIASHEFHHHTNEDNWSDYSHKCSAIISGFLQAIGNLVRFNNKQNGLFNFHINTSISQKQVGEHEPGKSCESVPTILIEATDCEVTPRTHANTPNEAEEKAVTAGKYDGPVCLLNERSKAGLGVVSETASYEQNAGKISTPIIISNQNIPQNEYYETEDGPTEVWNPIKTSLGDTTEPSKVEYSQSVPNGIAQNRKTTYEQTSVEFETPTTPPPESGFQVIPVTTSQPNFDLENSQGFQATPFENANEQGTFNPPPAAPNTPYAPQQSFSGLGIPPQRIVSVTHEEIISPNQLPPALPNEQGLPAMYPQQPSNNNLDVQMADPLLREPITGSYPDQMPVFLPPPQTDGNPQGGPDYPQNSPAFKPQNPNLEFSGNYLPPSEQAPPMKSSFELPPPDYNNNPSEVGFTQVEAPEQMTPTVDNSFTPDQQQTVALNKPDTVYYNDEPMNYDQVPRAPALEIQPEFTPTESQQTSPDYPSDIATNEQPQMNSMEVLPSDSVGPEDAVFSDSPVIRNGGVGATFNLPVASSFVTVIPPNSQPPIAPALIAPQVKPLVQQPTLPPPVQSKAVVLGIPLIQIPTNQAPGPSEMSGNPPINSFSSQLAPNTFIQPVPLGSISPSNDFPEQSRDKFATPQQPDSTSLIPLESTTPQPIPTLGPQPSPDFTVQLPENEMSRAVPQNFQNTVQVNVVPLQPSPVVAPTSDIIPRTPVQDSQLDYPTSIEQSEPSVSGLVPNNIGNQLSELTTYNKPVLNSNDFQPETQSYFTDPSDRNLDYTTQTPFYDSIPATYKSEPESQPGLISSVQDLSEGSTAPAPEQAFPPQSLQSFPIVPVRPELPPSTPDVTRTEAYSEQIRSEFDPTPTNPEFVNPPTNGFQMVAPGPGPQFMPPEQTFGDDKDPAMEQLPVAMQQPNPIPEISNPLNTNQPPVENSSIMLVQKQPQFYSNQNEDIQQPLPDTALTSQTSSQMATQQAGPETNNFPSAIPLYNQPITADYPQPPVQSGVPSYEIQPGNQPPNAPFYPLKQTGFSQYEVYPEPPRNENQPFQAAPQSDLPYQPPSIQIPSAESQEQFINPDATSAESTPNMPLESNIPPAASGAGESFPVEQQSAGFDGSQMSQQNYPNPGFPIQRVLPVDLPPAQVIAPQSFSGQSDPNLNYGGVQPNGIPQPEPQVPGNDQFSLQPNSNLQPIALPPQTGPMNSQNGGNPNEVQTFVPSASPQQTGVASFPLLPLQTVPENSQVNNFRLDSAFGPTVSPVPEISAKQMDNLMLNPDQPGVGQPERQDVNIQDQFPPAVPPQFATQSSGEATTDNQNSYQPHPSEDYFGGVPGVQTTNQMITSIDEYQSPATTTQEPLNYFQERPDDGAQTTPPPLQAEELLTPSQFQSEYVQNNAAMYSPNLAPRPQPQPSFDNLTEFPGDKTAGSTTQTPLPSEIKPETLGSQLLRQTALTETNIPDIDNTKTLDTQPKSRSSGYLDPQIYPNFDALAPAVNYPRQDRRSFPPTADSVTRDMTYQTTNPAFTSSQTVPTFGINPTGMVFNSNSSYFSTTVTPSEGLEMQPFRQGSALIASPQPQSTTEKFNEQIIIPQHQMPTASNPQPQATLKYADRQSGDNTEVGLLDSVAWTFPVPQEAMGTTPPPQYQTTPLRSPFPPSEMEFNDENKGRSFRPVQEQLVPLALSSVTPTPSFQQQEDYPQGKTTTKIVEEIITTDFPAELAQSRIEDQLVYADKLLNSSTPVQEDDQRMSQNFSRQEQQINFSPTVVTESFITPPTPFQQPLEIQNQPQIQSYSLTNSGEIETDPPVGRPGPLEQEIKVPAEVQLQPQFQSFPSTNMRETIADSPVIPTLPSPQQIDVQPQTGLQPFSSTISREMITNSLVSQPSPFQPQIQHQSQPHLEEFDSTNIREGIAYPPVTPPPLFQQQIDVQPQTQSQPFSSTISREIVTDSLRSALPPFQPQIEDQPQPLGEELDSTNIKEDVAYTTATPRPQFQPEIQIQPQQQFQIISATNTRENIADSPVTSSTPFPQQFQPQVEELDTKNIREGIVDSPVTPPPPFQPQIQVQPQQQFQIISATNMREGIADSPATSSTPFPQQFQPQAEEFDSTNIREGIAYPPVTPPPLFQQQIDVQPQTQSQPFSSTISRDIVTDSLTDPLPAFQPQTDQPQQVEELYSTNIKEDRAYPPATPPPQFQPEIQVEELDARNIKEELAYPSATPPTPLQPEIQVQPQQQYQVISPTNMREGIADSPITSSIPVPQQTDDFPQTELTPLSSTISREIVTNSLLRPPAAFQPQTEDQPQPQLQSFPSKNLKEIIADSPVIPSTPFQHQTAVQPHTELESRTNIMREVTTNPLVTSPPQFPQQMKVLTPPQPLPTNIREITTDSPINPPPLLQQQDDIQSRTRTQPFSSTISREVVTDSLTDPLSSFQPKIEVQSQPQPEGIYTTNVKEDPTTSPVAPPPLLQQQIDVQSQTQPQQFSSTISREVVTDSLTSRLPPFPPQIEDQPQPQVEELNSTNIKEDIAVPPVTPPPAFQPQIEVQTLPKLEGFDSTNIREDIAAPPVTPPPAFQPQIEVQTPPKLEGFDPTNIREVVTEQTHVPPQILLQPFSSTTSREIVTESLVSQPPPSQPQIQDQSQPHLEDLDSTNIREDVAVPPVTQPPTFQPQIELQTLPKLEGFDSTNIREDIAVPPVTQPPAFQPQIEVQTLPKPEGFDSTNIREDIAVLPVTQPPAFQPQIEVQTLPKPEGFDSTNIREVVTKQTDVQPQTVLQPFSSTTSRETVPESLVSQPPPFEPQTVVQSEPQLLSLSSPSTGDIKSDSPVSQSLPVQQELESQPQPQLPSLSSTNSNAVLTDSNVNPTSLVQQDVETVRQRDMGNFSSRNTTETVSDSLVSASASLEGAREQVQNQLHAFSAGNSTKVAADSLVNSAAKLEKHVAQEFQTQRTRYTTTNTKEVIIESFLPTSASTSVESGKDGQLKSVEIRSDSIGNSPGKKTTEVVEETVVTDFPLATEVSSLEDEFTLADKLLNNSTPVVKTTSFVTVSPLGGNADEELVTATVKIQKPVDQISVNTTSEKSEKAVPLSKSTSVKNDQVLPVQVPRESDEVVASNLNNQTTTRTPDRQSTSKSDSRPTYGPKYSQSRLANKPTAVSFPANYKTVSPDFKTSERKVLFKPIRAPQHQESSLWNPLLQTLETHLNLPLHDPPQLPSPKPGPRRAYLPSRAPFPISTRKSKSGAYIVKFKDHEKEARDTKSAPRPEPPVPVSNPTDPSNGPDPVKVSKNPSTDEVVAASGGENL